MRPRLRHRLPSERARIPSHEAGYHGRASCRERPSVRGGRRPVHQHRRIRVRSHAVSLLPRLLPVPGTRSVHGALHGRVPRGGSVDGRCSADQGCCGRAGHHGGPHGRELGRARARSRRCRRHRARPHAVGRSVVRAQGGRGAYRRDHALHALRELRRSGHATAHLSRESHLGSRAPTSRQAGGEEEARDGGRRRSGGHGMRVHALRTRARGDLVREGGRFGRTHQAGGHDQERRMRRGHAYLQPLDRHDREV